jgi:Ca2+-binding EF-hand superfamily protein
MIENILIAVDLNSNGMIDYTEFLASTIDSSAWLTE